MFATLPARLALIAALVFSQALYAGHSVKHASGNQLECQICLQTSASGAALPCGSITPALPVYTPVRPDGYPAPAASTSFPVSHPSRAPPLFSL